MSVFGNLKLMLAASWALACLPAAAAEVKPLASAPQVDRLWMGMEEGVIRPAAYEQLRAEADGHVAILAEDGGELAKGGHWATLDPEQLALERRGFEVEREKQEQQLRKGRDDARQARLRASLELHEAQGKRGELMAVARDTSLPPELARRAAEAVTRLDERIKVYQEVLDPAAYEKTLRLLEQECGLLIERKQKQLQDLEKHSRVTAGSAGRLRLGDGLKEKLASAKPGEPVWVKSGDLIGTVVDDGHYEISVAAAGPLLSEIPREQLLVFLQDAQTGRLIAGEYDRTDEMDNGREISRNFIFVIREDGVENARQAQGTRNLVHVYRKLPEPCRLVYKKDIAFVAPDVLESAGWAGLVRHLWPGSQVVQVGPQTIAVKPKDAH